MFVDRIDVAIAGRFKTAAHFLDIEPLADVQHQAAAEQEASGCQAVERRGDGHYQDAAGQLRQAIKGGDALGDDVLVRREQVVGQGFPVGEVQHREIRGEEGQFFLQAFGALAALGQYQREAACAVGRFGYRQGEGGTGQVAPLLFAGAGRQRRKTQYGHGRLAVMTKGREL